MTVCRPPQPRPPLPTIEDTQFCLKMLPSAHQVVIGMTMATVAAATCTTPSDCSLLGDCSSGRCACDPGWTSANCSSLDLVPARWGHGRQARETNTSSWGGNVIRDTLTGKYHLFFSEMRVDGLHSYSEPGHCQLTTASADSALGPFVSNRTVLRSSAVGGPTRGQISHNVQPLLGGDGAVYVFFITSDPQPADAADAGSSTARSTAAAAALATKPPKPPKKKLSVMVGRAAKIGAAFEWATPRLLTANGTLVLKDNPSAVVFGNGSVHKDPCC